MATRYTNFEEYVDAIQNNIFAEVQAKMFGYGRAPDDDPDAMKKHIVRHDVYIIGRRGDPTKHFCLHPDTPRFKVNENGHEIDDEDRRVRVERFDMGYIGDALENFMSTFIVSDRAMATILCPNSAGVGMYKAFAEGTTVQTLMNSLSESGYEGSVRKALDTIEDETCPICIGPLTNPTITNCKHLFCGGCLTQSLAFNKKCPCCRVEVTTTREIDEVVNVPCNADQAEIVKGLQQSLELVQGPPGTGKSTTIYHLITARLKGRTLVTSINNQAIAAVCEKLKSEHTPVSAGGKIHMVVLGGANRISDACKPFHIDSLVESKLKESIELTTLRATIVEATIARDNDRAVRTERVAAFIESLDLDQRDLERLIVFGDDASKCTKGKPRYLEILQDYADGMVYVSPLRMLDGRKIDIATLRPIDLVAAIEASKACEGPVICDCESDADRELKILQSKYARIEFRLREEFKEQILKDSNVFLCTIASSWRAKNITTAIIDEAATVSEECMPTLMRCRPSNIILIGDHRQLKPFSNIDQCSPQSFFERAVKDHCRIHMLRTQYRMAPKIGNLVSKLFYDGRLKHGVRYDNDILEWVNCTTAEQKEGTSPYNPGEIDEVCRLCRAYRHANEAKSIMVITFYRQQARRLKERLQDICKVVTVDACQGTEADAVFLSCVRSNHSIGFCRNPNRLCVALSRAKERLTIVGNRKTFQRWEHWRKIIQLTC